MRKRLFQVHRSKNSIFYLVSFCEETEDIINKQRKDQPTSRGDLSNR